MKLILETTDRKYYLTTSREYYLTTSRDELIVIRDRLGNLPDWVYTLSCAEQLKIIQYDDDGHRIIVGNKVTCRF